jgi:hypothetical protein
MPQKPQWRAADFGELEARLTEVRDLLAQAARMIEAREMENIADLADMTLEQEARAHEHTNGRRYR